MKKTLKKCAGYALIFGFTLPAFGYQWTIYNAMPEDALVQLNVSAQVMRQVIPSGQSVVFNYNTHAGWHNILWCGGLCLTTIYAQPMSSSQLEPAHMSKLEETIFEKMIKDIPDIIKAIANVEDPAAEVKAALKLLYDAISILIALLSKLCNSGTWIITKDPRTGEMHSMFKTS